MFDMGKRICKLRRDAHLSQKQLGEKIGKSASTIGSYENDTAVPTLENAAALAEALHVSLDYLLYGEKSRTLPLQPHPSAAKDEREPRAAVDRSGAGVCSTY